MTTETIADAHAGRTDAADTSGIDAVLADTHATTGTDTGAKSSDIDPDSLEGRLRLALPGHTFFRTTAAIPEQLKGFLEKLGADEDQLVGMGGPTVLKAMFTEPTGYWLIAVQSCHSGDHGYRVNVDGPGTDVTRDVQTISDVLGLLRTLGVIK